MIQKNIIIAFAGAVGSSKTPIAYYLSWNLDLPIFSNDSIRIELIEETDTLGHEYLRRRNDRLNKLIASKKSFIYDASVDREWANWEQKFSEAGYDAFIISLDLSQELLTKFYHRKNYQTTLPHLDTLLEDHKNFLEKYSHKVGLHITDENFNQRLDLSLKTVKNWLSVKI